MRNDLHWIDGFVIVAYAGGMLALGWFYSRKKQTTEEYFTGGRAMNPLLIGISLYATLLSTITYLAGPGEIIKNGPFILIGALSIPIAFLIVGYGLIPIFMRYRVTSAYELLEYKLGSSSRMFGAVMFVVMRMVWMAVLLNFAANAMLVMLGLDKSWLFAATSLIGLIAITYSSLGGLRAVVITDLVQFVLLLGGAIMVIVIVTIKLGSLDWFPTSWESNWQSQPVFSIDPYVRLTVASVLLMDVLWWVCTAGSDQTVIQRYMATRDARAARRSFLANSLAAIVVWSVLALVGLALLGYYKLYPQHLPSGMGIVDAADSLFPHFIAHQLPIGVSGLVISGMFAAAMSSIDSGLNSISAVVMTDFVGRYRETPLSQRQQVRTAKSLALCVGIVVIATSTLSEYVPGNLIEISKRTAGLLMTPIFTLFFMSLFVRFATPKGANVGAFCGLITAVIISFWNPLIEDRSISFTWISPVSLVVSISVGCAISLLTRRKPPPEALDDDISTSLDS